MNPDSRKCSWSFLSERTETAPNIQFTPKALKWIKAMVEEHSEEVGFLGIVREVDSSYVIDEIFYPKHCLATSSTCEIAPEGEVELAQYLIDNNRVEDVARVRFWGHSHHTMGTTPSGQDDDQALQKMNNNGAYFVRAICNKKGEMSVSFFDHERQLKFENVKWSICENYDEILANVICATNMESNSKGKVQAIRAAISAQIDYKDDEYKKITEKVKELKKKNLPASETRGLARQPYQRGVIHSPGHYPNDILPGFQQDMFDDDWPPYGPEFYRNNAGQMPYQRRQSNFPKVNGARKNKRKKNRNGALLSDKEIDSVVSEAWEGGL